MDTTAVTNNVVKISYKPFSPMIEPLSRLEARMVRRFEEREATREVMRAQNRWLYEQSKGEDVK